MTPAQRQAAFSRFLVSLCRERAERLGLAFGGTIRKLPPPALPGEPQGSTRYFLNALSGEGASLVELTGPDQAALRRAERWAESGEGKPPPLQHQRAQKIR